MITAAVAPREDVSDAIKVESGFVAINVN